jgi:hypothetical protein
MVRNPPSPHHSKSVDIILYLVYVEHNTALNMHIPRPPEQNLLPMPTKVL